MSIFAVLRKLQSKYIHIDAVMIFVLKLQADIMDMRLFILKYVFVVTRSASSRNNFQQSSNRLMRKSVLKALFLEFAWWASKDSPDLL